MFNDQLWEHSDSDSNDNIPDGIHVEIEKLWNVLSKSRIKNPKLDNDTMALKHD